MTDPATNEPATPPPETYHTYESRPVPWWILALWIAYFLFAIGYLSINLLSTTGGT